MTYPDAAIEEAVAQARDVYDQPALVVDMAAMILADRAEHVSAAAEVVADWLARERVEGAQ